MPRPLCAAQTAAAAALGTAMVMNQHMPALLSAAVAARCEWVAVALVTDGKVQAAFALENKGKQAVYAVRWIGPTGEPGPWGEEVRAVVAA